MQKKMRIGIAVAAGLLALCVARTSHATNYSVYIHGFTGLSGCGHTPSGWCYWGGAAQPGINPIAANYDGTAHLSTSSGTVKTLLDGKCLTGSGNSCYIAAHSYGCAMMGYLEAVYPARWSIIWMDGAGCAAGGSELANAVDWANSAVQSMSGYGYGAISDLTTSNMRSASFYNHDKLGDKITGHVYSFMGGDWAVYDNGFFPSGGNDIVVAYHSSGLWRNIGGYQTAPASCNATTGANCVGGQAWDYTINSYQDDYYWGTYYHVSGLSPWTGGTGPITMRMASDMNTYAH